MAVLSAKTVYETLRRQGANAEEAAVLTAIAKVESGFNTTVKNPSSTATGLWQFLRMHWGRGQFDPKDPSQAARAALGLFRGGGGIRQLGSGGAGHWEALTLAADGNATWKRRWDAAIGEAVGVAAVKGDAIDSAKITSLSGLDSSAAVAAAGATEATEAATTAAAEPTGPIPTGYELIKVGGDTYIAYELGDGDAAITMFYKAIGDVPAGPVTTMDEATWRERVAANQYIDAGTTAAFEDLDHEGSYQEMFESVLYEMGLMGTSALQDSEVMGVVGLMLSRPDMSPEEFKNRLNRTAWAQSMTDRQKTWNDKSKAQQDQEIMTTAAQAISQALFTYAGMDLDLTGVETVEQLAAMHPDAYKYAKAIASGEMTDYQVVETWIKTVARDDPESPWMRRLRDEEKARGAHGVDIEDQAKAVMDLYYQYGLPITQAEAKEIGEQLVMNQKSFLDVQESVRDQAEALYPHKPREVATRTWAKPYTSTMAQMWEISDEVDLDDPTLQRALGENQNLGEFRKQLKSNERWLTTNNAQEETHGIISELGKRMGF